MAEELDTLPLKEIQKMAVMMSKSATNLYSLLDNMLQWTKMNQGKITFEPQKLNFKKISHEAVSILKPNADEKTIKINHIASDDITVYADIFMFKTILRNLVVNAIKVTDCNGQIDISALQTDSYLTISVADYGNEIAPDHLSRMFNNSDLHKTLGSAEDKGTTLGLMLCRQFVEKHGGKIWVENKNGGGSEFKFTIPAGT
jgi:signal transduction histidine kinase